MDFEKYLEEQKESLERKLPNEDNIFVYSDAIKDFMDFAWNAALEEVEKEGKIIIKYKIQGYEPISSNGYEDDHMDIELDKHSIDNLKK